MREIRMEKGRSQNEKDRTAYANGGVWRRSCRQGVRLSEKEGGREGGGRALQGGGDRTNFAARYGSRARLWEIPSEPAIILRVPKGGPEKKGEAPLPVFYCSWRVHFKKGRGMSSTSSAAKKQSRIPSNQGTKGGMLEGRQQNQRGLEIPISIIGSASAERHGASAPGSKPTTEESNLRETGWGRAVERERSSAGVQGWITRALGGGLRGEGRLGVFLG